MVGVILGAGMAPKTGVKWEMYCNGSLAAALSVAMADMVRQVEVHCAERGRTLTLLWNLYTATMDAAVGEH